MPFRILSRLVVWAGLRKPPVPRPRVRYVPGCPPGGGVLTPRQWAEELGVPYRTR